MLKKQILLKLKIYEKGQALRILLNLCILFYFFIKT
jgi:hypothetical protein